MAAPPALVRRGQLLTALQMAGGFRLDDPLGEVGIEFMYVRTGRA